MREISKEQAMRNGCTICADATKVVVSAPNESGRLTKKRVRMCPHERCPYFDESDWIKGEQLKNGKYAVVVDGDICEGVNKYEAKALIAQLHDLPVFEVVGLVAEVKERRKIK